MVRFIGEDFFLVFRWPPSSYVLTRKREREREFFTSRRPYLLIPSKTGLGLQILFFLGGGDNIQSIISSLTVSASYMHPTVATVVPLWWWDCLGVAAKAMEKTKRKVGDLLLYSL